MHKGAAEMSWPPYERAKGREKRLLGRIALQPMAKWFGKWIPDRDIAAKVPAYVDNATGGDRDVLVPMTLFRMVPWEQEACNRVSTRAEKESYRRFVRRFAKAVGRTHAAIVLQPDGSFALCAPNGSRSHSRLIAWSARRLAEQPNASVYVEAGSSGWNHEDPANAVRLLVRGGIEHARGFHLNTTHYVSTASQVRFGARVVAGLEERGLTGKHFNHARACQRKMQKHCFTLGVLPTTHVAAKRWGLPRDVRRLAREHVDAYLWAGRPWLRMQSEPFLKKRALALARTTPYQ